VSGSMSLAQEMSFGLMVVGIVFRRQHGTL
jgi:hypothetical protein